MVVLLSSSYRTVLVTNREFALPIELGGDGEWVFDVVCCCCCCCVSGSHNVLPSTADTKNRLFLSKKRNKNQNLGLI